MKKEELLLQQHKSLWDFCFFNFSVLVQKEIVKIDRKWTKGVNFYSMKIYVLS